MDNDTKPKVSLNETNTVSPPKVNTKNWGPMFWAYLHEKAGKESSSGSESTSSLNLK